MDQKTLNSKPWNTEHRDLGDGGYRAAIMGFTDGLVTNLCLILGVQFALEELGIFYRNVSVHPLIVYIYVVSSREIIITGLAGLISGSFSMSVGEYIRLLDVHCIVFLRFD